MQSHKNTYLSLEEVGKQVAAYQPTFDFEGDYINGAHRYFSDCPVNDNNLIQVRHPLRRSSILSGYLLREDALKLYELAYFVKGNILELGSYRGLSTSILSRANQDSPFRKQIVSVDRSPKSVLYTNFNLYGMHLKQGVEVIWGDAAAEIRRLARDHAEFDFVFIDHAHGYDPVYAVCTELKKIMSSRGFCLFHDFNVPENADEENGDYKVYQAVRDGLSATDFEFYGMYGCSALYRAR
jgi:predicted O-methyltransferase YrrM